MQVYSIRKALNIPQCKITEIISEKEVHIPPTAGEEIQRDKETIIVWKNFGDAQPPKLHKSKFVPQKLSNKVAVDVIWHPMCMILIVERANVREVCEEYKDRVVLREFDAGDIDFLKKYEICRGLFFNGISKCWGYEAPKEEVKKVIEDLLSKKA